MEEKDQDLTQADPDAVVLWLSFRFNLLKGCSWGQSYCALGPHSYIHISDSNNGEHLFRTHLQCFI